MVSKKASSGFNFNSQSLRLDGVRVAQLFLGPEAEFRAPVNTWFFDTPRGGVGQQGGEDMLKLSESGAR